MTSTLKVSSIQDPTNSNTALSIDSSGHVTMPNKPFVSAAWDGSSGDVIGGLFRYTAYETADHNLVSGNHKIFYKNDFNMLNTSTGVVSVPVTGIYLIVGHYADETGATAARSIGALWKGNVYLGEWQESYGQYDDQSAVRLLYLTPSDTIQFGHNNGFPYDDFGFAMVLVG